MKRFNVLRSLLVLFAFFLIAWGFVPGEVEGAVPQLINFQGVLRDGSGNPVPDASYSVTFTIYDAASGGNVKWTETQSVTTMGGLFTVLLGSTTPLPDSVFYDSSRYLGMAVSPDAEMTPRQRLSSVGYSSVSSQWTSAGQNLFRLNGNVGIGTTSPGAPLSFANTSGDKVFIWNGGVNDKYGIGLQNLLLQIFTGSTASAIAFGHGNSGSFTELMRINGNGNVGIGTTSPQAGLHVAGSVAGKSVFTNNSTGHSSTDGLHIGFGSGTSDAFIVNYENATLQLGVDNSFDVTIKSGGTVGIGTTSPGASNLLELSSTTKGFVLPRMTKTERDAIASPVAGMMVYQTDNTPGLRVYNGTNWMRFTETAD